MRQAGQDIGHTTEIGTVNLKTKTASIDDFVLEKSIFNNIFEKDIRRVFIYKKAERLAKAIHLIGPAFAGSSSLHTRIDAIAVALVDAATLPPGTARTALSRELLTLSSVLSIARTGGLLSSMNTELIAHEAHRLLQEIAGYEEPRISLDEAPTLSDIAKSASKKELTNISMPLPTTRSTKKAAYKGHIKDTGEVTDIHIKDRRDAILSVIKNKKKASIKDISTVIRTVSEKTIQRELLSLIGAGVVLKEGERRWSLYSLI